MEFPSQPADVVRDDLLDNHGDVRQIFTNDIYYINFVVAIYEG